MIYKNTIKLCVNKRKELGLVIGTRPKASAHVYCTSLKVRFTVIYTPDNLLLCKFLKNI